MTRERWRRRKLIKGFSANWLQQGSCWNWILQASTQMGLGGGSRAWLKFGQAKNPCQSISLALRDLFAFFLFKLLIIFWCFRVLFFAGVGAAVAVQGRKIPGKVIGLTALGDLRSSPRSPELGMGAVTTWPSFFHLIKWMSSIVSKAPTVCISLRLKLVMG